MLPGEKLMAQPAQSFGKRLRARRLACGFGLREFARMLGISSTYLSQIEQENVDPPTAERAEQIAKMLGEDADEWIALAGRVPEDLEGIIHTQPVGFPMLLREASGLSAEQLKTLAEQAKQMREGKQ